MVKQRNNIINFNGRRYDATTGRLLQSEGAVISDIIAIKPTTAKTVDAKPVKQRLASQSATNIHKRTSKSVTLKRSVANPSKAKPISSTNISAPQPVASRTIARPIRAHQPTKSAILMRTSVKKPVVERKPKLKTTTHSTHLAKQPSTMVVAKRMSDSLDLARLDRAKHIPKHTRVDRFYKPTKLIDALAAEAPAHIPVKPAPAAPVKLPKANNQDIFTKALENARSHEQTYKKPKARRRSGSRVAASLAVTVGLLVAVFGLAYTNRDRIEMQFASAQAGFGATLPAYTPGGFSYSGVNHNSGELKLTYKDAASNTSYTINEEPSAWNSQTLLDSFGDNHTSYTTLSAGGRTVYVSGNQATWVSGGILYTLSIEGSNLPESELLKIVTSL